MIQQRVVTGEQHYEDVGLLSPSANVGLLCSSRISSDDASTRHNRFDRVSSGDFMETVVTVEGNLGTRPDFSDGVKSVAFGRVSSGEREFPWAVPEGVSAISSSSSFGRKLSGEGSIKPHSTFGRLSSGEATADGSSFVRCEDIVVNIASDGFGHIYSASS